TSPVFQSCQSPEGRVDVYSGMANAYYDVFSETARLRPFIGAGVGLARTYIGASGRMEGITTPTSNDERYLISANGEKTTWAAQIIAGASLSLSSQLKLDLAYRYFLTDDLDLSIFARERTNGSGSSSGPGFAPDLGGKVGADKDEDHALTVGLRWAFGPPQ